MASVEVLDGGVRPHKLSASAVAFVRVVWRLDTIFSRFSISRIINVTQNMRHIYAASM